jgi:hypothetical protein
MIIFHHAVPSDKLKIIKKTDEIILVSVANI